MKFKSTLAATVALSFVTVSCSSTTTINSTPSGASLSINGNAVGQTPYTYTDSKVLFSKQQVALSMKGYTTFQGFIARDELAVGTLLIGLLCVWPALLWAWEYPPSYNFTLQKKGGDASLRTTPGPVVWSPEFVKVSHTKIPLAKPEVSHIQLPATF